MESALEKYFSLIRSKPSIFANENAPLKIITDLDTILAWQKEKRVELQQKGLPLEWAEIGVVIDDPYVLLIRDLVEFPDATKNGYIRFVNRADFSGGQGVVVMACVNDRILLLRQFRHATRSWHLEVPRGYGEPGVSAAKQAADELQEEIGATIGKLESLGVMHNNSSFEGQPVHLFFAQLNSIGKPSHQEGIERFILVTLSELESFIRDGKITDGFTIAAYARAKLAGLI